MTTAHHNILLVDAGNTRLKWRLLEAGQLTDGGACVHYGAELGTLLSVQWAQLQPARVLLASVADPVLTQSITRWVSSTWQQSIESITAQASAFGVCNAYSQPAQLGVDRWLGLLAARRHVEGAACIIDCGTALTVDVLDASGVHHGGIIVPGMQMMRTSLATKTGRISDQEPWSAEFHNTAWLGRDTASGIVGGVMAATVGAVTQVVQQARQELAVPLHCVVTGGDAELLVQHWNEDVRMEPDWVLKGLAIVAEGEQ